MSRFTLMLCCALLALPITAAQIDKAQIDKERFEPLDLFDLAWVSDPQISPDGKRVVYVRESYDIIKDGNRASLWIIDSDGDHHEPLTSPANRASSPRWSPDGKRLAYVSSADGSSQIHVRWLDSDRDVAITYLQESPRALSWSPDGKRLAFVQFVPMEHDPIAKMPTKPKGAEWAADAKVYEDSFYRADGGGFLKSGKTHVFMVDADGGMPVQLTHDDFPHGGGLSWSRTSDAIYFSSNYRANWQIDRTESEIYKVNINTRKTTQITDRDGGDFDPQVSPDGKWLAYRGSDDTNQYENTELYIASMAAFKPRKLISVDIGVSDIVWAADSDSLYIGYQEKAVAKVGRVDLKGKLEEVATGLGGSSIGRPYATGSFSVANNGSIAHDATSPDQPANLAVTTRGKTRTLTNLNADMVAYKSISEPEEIWYTSSKDGLQIEGWILKPPGFDPAKKYPLILEIHGGPNSAYGNYFAAELQLYAAAGYVVLYTNPRGSTSYGEAFTREIDRDYPGSDYDDLMSGVDAMIARGYVDTDNLFVTGGSGGGILTAWIVTKTDRFRAAVSQKPVINWFTHTLTADIGPFFWKNWFASLPWEDPASYLAKSPIGAVDKVKTPTMLITGEEDFRTPISEAEQFYQGLKMSGVDSALVRIQGASHDIASKPSNLLRKVAYVLGWFDRYKTSESEAGSGQR